MGKTKREKEEGRRWNEMREEKAKKEKNNESKKDNRRVIDLGWRERDSEVRRRDEKTSTRKIPQVDPYL